MKQLKKFLFEYEVLTIPVFTLLAIFSYDFLKKVFFAAPSDSLAEPTLQSFYFAIFTVLIWAFFMLVVWVWFKQDSPKSAEVIKRGWQGELTEFVPINNSNAELIYAYAKFFFYWLTLLGVAWAVFP